MCIFHNSKVNSFVIAFPVLCRGERWERLDETRPLTLLKPQTNKLVIISTKLAHPSTTIYQNFMNFSIHPSIHPYTYFIIQILYKPNRKLSPHYIPLILIFQIAKSRSLRSFPFDPKIRAQKISCIETNRERNHLSLTYHSLITTR